LNWQQWFSVLKLARMWQMDEIQDLAVERISKLPTTTNEWVAVLRWSTLWGISEIREKAINALEHGLQSIERIILARECKISDWVLRGYGELVGRNETISESDEEQLGCETVAKLFRIKDLRRFHQNDRGQGGYQIVNIVNNYNVDDAIRTAFKMELGEAECYQKSFISYARDEGKEIRQRGLSW
jgi:hypothetical protein